MSAIRRSLEDRRGNVERARQIEGGLWLVEGFVDCVGVGEATVDVVFPVTFVEMPIVAGGGYLDDNEVIVPGWFPRWKVDVRRWVTFERADRPNEIWYKGANLIVTIQGDPENAIMRSVAWFEATGRALTNPIVGGL